MKTKVSIQKLVIGAALAIAIIFGGFTFYSKSKLKNRLEDEKLKTEMLLSEQMRLNKSVSKYQSDLTELQNKVSDLKNLIAEANLKISFKNTEISKLKAENGSVKELKQKYAELEMLKQQLDEEIENLNHLLADAKAENSKLNNQLASSLLANEELAGDISLLKALFSDNYRTEALRGKNEKLTINAKRTDKLLVSLDLPGSFGKAINFKIITPQGKEISSITDLTATMKITENSDGLLVSSEPKAFGEIRSKRVEMAYKPSNKLTKGIYHFNLYNNERFIGSTQLRLK